MNRRRAWGFVLFLLAGACPTHAAPAATTPDPWLHYFSAQGHEVAWARTVRGKDRGSQDSTRLAGAGDLIVPVDWGLRSGKDARAVAARVRTLRSGQAGPASRELARRVRALEKAHRGGRVYWQVGNEINSRSMARSLGPSGALARPDDPALVPLYAEMLLAPAVEVLRAAGQELYGDPARVRIVLGSIASIHRAGAREWLERLLDYRIEGAYAPTLAGRKVYELVSVVSVHYAATADDPPWEQIFDGIETGLRARGSPAAVWATEELGKRRAAAGLGAATAVRVAAGYLARAAASQRDAVALRCSLYGWARGAPGTTGDEGMQLLSDAFGRGRVTYLGSLPVQEPGGALRTRLFRAENGRNLGVVYGHAGAQAALDGFSLPASGAPALRFSGTLLGPGGMRTIAFVARPDGAGGTVRYRPSRPVPIGRGETLLIREIP